MAILEVKHIEKHFDNTKVLEDVSFELEEGSALAERKTTVIIVTHEMAFARDVADQVIFMDGGLIVEQGKPDNVINHPREERTRQFLARYTQG